MVIKFVDVKHLGDASYTENIALYIGRPEGWKNENQNI